MGPARSPVPGYHGRPVTIAPNDFVQLHLPTGGELGEVRRAGGPTLLKIDAGQRLDETNTWPLRTHASHWSGPVR